MAILEVQGLVKNYGRRRVVNGVSFDVNAGEVVGLLGPNGAGKTTSFRMTTGMISPYAGTVRFGGNDVTSWPMYRRARLGMGYLSQESSVFRKLTVEQNVLAILEAVPSIRSLGRAPNRKERHAITERMLEQFGLLGVRRSLAATLSGGEKRRLEIARCLVTEPKLILLDEPFTGIDPKTISDIQAIVRALRAHNIGMLITDHNVRETLRITDRSYVITDGVVEAHGTPQEIIRHPVVIQKYLGQDFARDAMGTFRTDPPQSPGHGPHIAPQANANPPNPPPGGPTPGGPPPKRTAPAHPPQPTVPFPTPSSPASAGDRPGAGAPPGAIQRLLEQERIVALIERLKGPECQAAEQHLLAAGLAAVPALIDALERRDVDIRAAAFRILHRLSAGQLQFDPYAPEAQRRQQIEVLRQSLRRKAG